MPSRPLLAHLRAITRQTTGIQRTVCPSCQFTSLLRQYRVRSSSSRQIRRNASTLSSSTAVNASKDIPPELEKLHSAVGRLQKDAPNYVNISRLQLALRSLENNNPVIRVAVLGLQSNRAARQLARLLVTDVLGAEGAWERQLVEAGKADTRSFILRYGNEEDLPPPNALVSTLHIPSPLLHSFSLEILISSLNLDPTSSEGPNNYHGLKSTALVPLAETQSSFSGQVSFVRYPVHRALIVAEGLGGALALGKCSGVSAQADVLEDDTVKLALQLPALAQEDVEHRQESAITVLDIAKAAEGIALFRQSNTNGVAYERAWYASGLPALTEWLFPRGTGPSSTLRAAVLNLVDSLLDETTQSILRDDTAHLSQLTTTRVPDTVRQPLHSALSAWATASHTELQSSLEKAFVSEPWHKLKWYKLFWRVDDVGMLLSELLERAWLVQAEKGVIFLAGRGAEAGIYREEEADSALAEVLSDDALLGERDMAIKPLETTTTDPEEVEALRAAAEASKPTAVTPWPKTIPLARQHLGLTTIPPLQSLAQSLIVQTLSLTTSSTALSALIYLSLPSVSLFEAGAVGALGLVYSLRRMQKKWEGARSEWQVGLRERGRIVLRGTEEGMREALERSGDETGRKGHGAVDVGVQDRRLAREAVTRVRKGQDYPFPLYGLCADRYPCYVRSPRCALVKFESLVDTLLLAAMKQAADEVKQNARWPLHHDSAARPPRRRTQVIAPLPHLRRAPLAAGMAVLDHGIGHVVAVAVAVDDLPAAVGRLVLGLDLGRTVGAIATGLDLVLVRELLGRLGVVGGDDVAVAGGVAALFGWEVMVVCGGVGVLGVVVEGNVLVVVWRGVDGIMAVRSEGRVAVMGVRGVAVVGVMSVAVVVVLSVTLLVWVGVTRARNRVIVDMGRLWECMWVRRVWDAIAWWILVDAVADDWKMCRVLRFPRISTIAMIRLLLTIKDRSPWVKRVRKESAVERGAPNDLGKRQKEKQMGRHMAAGTSKHQGKSRMQKWMESLQRSIGLPEDYMKSAVVSIDAGQDATVEHSEAASSRADAKHAGAKRDALRDARFPSRPSAPARTSYPDWRGWQHSTAKRRTLPISYSLVRGSWVEDMSFRSSIEVMLGRKGESLRGLSSLLADDYCSCQCAVAGLASGVQQPHMRLLAPDPALRPGQQLLEESTEVIGVHFAEFTEHLHWYWQRLHHIQDGVGQVKDILTASHALITRVLGPLRCTESKLATNISMAVDYTALAAASAIFGVFSHLGYFIHGEKDLNSRTYVALWTSFQALGFAGLVRLGEQSLGASVAIMSTGSAAWLCGVFSSMVIYRLFFHRLRSFPGPRSWAITKFTHFFTNASDFYGYKHLHALHEKHGAFVRTGPCEISIIDPAAPALVLGPGSKCTKAVWYDMGKPLMSMHQVRSKALHDKRRRVWDHGFGAKALRDYENRVIGYAEQLMENMKSYGGQALNASKWFNYYSFDVMGDLAFGQPFDMLTKGQTHFAIDLLQKGMEALAFAGTVPWFFYILSAIPGIGADYHTFIRWCDDQVTRRQAMKVPTKDIMSWLLAAPPMSANAVDNRMWLTGDSRLIIVAGSDTTASTLTFALYELLRNPAVLARLRDELTPLLAGLAPDATAVALQKATLLNAVIDETLRLHPPVPSGVLRNAPPEGITVNGTFVPGGVTISMPLYSLQRSAAAYARPDEFVPERWTTQPELVRVKGAFAPFSMGPYGCVGKGLALMELRTVLSMLVTRFDIGFAEGEDGRALVEESTDHFTMVLKDLMVVCRPRA
ncbi:hypothetical protein FH972_024560 [Carpinus fangiana]|uniref:Mmc1 C-terminal domain-containing protein n=1 Tax=Carpinus fangiana TaxID=176857 RepID=A0A5N6KYT8_9ROSI|nr:hypothetical protein FH972_024560 [Carpinus fangiana]